MSDYIHDVFVSYLSGDENWVKWTKSNIVDLLQSNLSPAVGKLKIYHYFGRNQSSGDWPDDLAKALSRSKLIVPILCKAYFQSPWCRVELALMHHRVQSVKQKTNQSHDLIIPLIIHDGDEFPDEVRRITHTKIHDLANPAMRDDSPVREKLSQLLKDEVCGRIENALTQAPPFDPSWEQLAGSNFEHVFKVEMKSQKTLPKLELPKPPTTSP